MSLEPQPRKTDGKYSQKDHSLPEVPLAEEVDGSFLFPPSEWPGGAPQYLAFWREQPISDDALTSFTSAYAADWDEWGQPLIDQHLYVWGNGEESRQLRKSGASKEQLWEAREAQGRLIISRLEQTRPRRIPMSIVRHVARAAQIIHNADRLATVGDQVADRTADIYRNNDGDTFSATELWDRFMLDEIMPDAFYSRQNALQREVRELRESLTRPE